MRSFLKPFSKTPEARLLLVNVVLFVVLSAFAEGFFSVQNALNLMTSYAFVGILAAGLVVVLVAGGIDISFTAVASIAQYLAVSAVVRYEGSWVMLLAVALGGGVLLGLINAVLVTWLRISSIIVTIALLNVYYGMLMFWSGGDPINSLPSWYADSMYWILGEDRLGNPYVLNMQILGLVLAFVLSWLLLNRMSVGRQLRALGGNPEAAKRVGFDELRLNMVAYGFMGLMAGIAALVQAQGSQSVVPNALVGRELGVLAAVVLGGASLTGGMGTVFGTVLGLILFAFLQDGLILLGVSSYWIQFVTGFVFLGAVGTIAWERKRVRRAVRRNIGGAT